MTLQYPYAATTLSGVASRSGIDVDILTDFKFPIIVVMLRGMYKEPVDRPCWLPLWVKEKEHEAV